MKIMEVPESSTILIDAVNYCLTNFPSQMTFYDKKKKKEISLQWKNHFAAFTVEQLYKSIDLGALTWDKMPSISEMLVCLKCAKNESQKEEFEPFLIKDGCMNLKQYLESIGVPYVKKKKGVFDEPKNGTVKIPDFLVSTIEALEVVNTYNAINFIKSLPKFKGINKRLLRLLVDQKQLDILAEINFSEDCSRGKCVGFHIDFSFANGFWYTSTRPCGRSRR